MSNPIDIYSKQSTVIKVDLDSDTALSKQDKDNSDSIAPVWFPTHGARTKAYSELNNSDFNILPVDWGADALKLDCLDFTESFINFILLEILKLTRTLKAK